LHREVLLERQSALFRKRRVRLTNLLCWLAIGFEHLEVAQSGYGMAIYLVILDYALVKQIIGEASPD
jgi:hypothetical protein